MDSLREFLERFAADRAALYRALPPLFAPARSERLRAFWTEWQTALDTIDFDTLEREAQADAALFANLLRGERDDLRLTDQRRSETAHLLPFAPTITELDAERRRMERPDAPLCAAQLDAATVQINSLKRAFAMGEPVSVSAVTRERAALAVEQMRETLGDWFRFFDGYDPLFSWWVREPHEAADTALKGYIVVLRGGDSTGDRIVGDPMGEEALRAALERELIPYTPDELIAIGDREFRWCEAEMRKASGELGFGDDWRAAMEMVKTRHAAPGEQPTLVRDLALEAIRFVEDRDLVTIPPLAREVWRMAMMTPEAQKVNPFFLGGEKIIVSFPTGSMTQTQKRMSLRGNNRHFARATVQHELIPGHHLQLFMAERWRTHRRIFSTPFFIEGWAIHWEFLLWDSGFALSPEDRIGMLFWRMHRCARVRFSLRYHLEQMSADACVEMLVEQVGHERENALAEIRRSLGDDYPPLYQAAYLLGGIQMRSLYRELVTRGTMTPRDFHDAVLQRNSVPIALLRAEMTGQPIPRTLTELNWRFDSAKEAA